MLCLNVHLRNSGTLVWSLCASASLLAQTHATHAELKGTVRSEAGKPMAGLLLTLVNPATHETRIVKSDGEGRYGFALIHPGNYRLSVKDSGVVRKVQDLVIPMASTLLLDLDLRSEAAGVVAVEVDASRMDPVRTQVSQIIGSDLIEGLPINRRSFADFSLTVPGVRTSNMPTTGGAPSSGLSFLGMNARQNRFLVDGLDNNDQGTGSVRSALSQEAVQEFQVITANYSAEFGRAAGGIVNSVLKSGTNTFAGSLFAYDRPGQWDARSAGGVGTKDFRQSQLGFSASGPILKDQLFFFACAERFQKRDQNSVLIDPQALAIIQGAGFSAQSGTQPYEESQTTSLLKLDFAPSSNQRWGLRLIQNQSANENQIPWGGLVDRSAGGKLDERDTTVALTHQWLGSESWVNEARLQYGRRRNQYLSMDPTNGVSVTIAGTAAFGTQRLTPQDTTTETFQLVDVATFSMDRHTLKAGLDLLRTSNRGTVQENTAGIYQFSAIPAGLLPAPLVGGFPTSLSAFGAGFPVAFIQSWGSAYTSFRTESDAVFIQDDWQIHPRLLLKLGLRYERERLPEFEDAPAYGNLQNAPAVADPIYGPVRLPDGAHPYSQLFQVQRNWDRSRVAPRLGFSWQASDELRAYGGWGVFSGSTQLGPLFGARLFNDQGTQTTMRTLLDPPTVWPYLSWTGADGVARNHRYAAPPSGYSPTIVIPGNYGMPETKTWSLGLEWAPAAAHTFFLDFVKSRGEGFQNVRDVNAHVPYFSPALNMVLQRRPDMRFGSVQRIDGTGESRYQGETLGWQWKPSDSIQIKASYTHGKAEDNYIDWTPDFPPQDTFNPSNEWGPSCENLKHQGLLSAVWVSHSNTPWGRGWLVSVLARYASGRPYSKLLGYDRNLNGDPAADRPEGLERNSETLLPSRTVDMRLARRFNLSGCRLECSIEAFNLFNTANVLEVQNNLASTAPAYGTALRFAPMRQLQFGVRARF